jgi:hypothetical protein
MAYNIGGTDYTADDLKSYFAGNTPGQIRSDAIKYGVSGATLSNIINDLNPGSDYTASQADSFIDYGVLPKAPEPSKPVTIGTWSGTENDVSDYIKTATPTQVYQDLGTYGASKQDLINAVNRVSGGNTTTQQGTEFFTNDQAGFTKLYDAAPDKNEFISAYMNTTGASYIDMANLTGIPYDTLKANMKIHLDPGKPSPGPDPGVDPNTGQQSPFAGIIEQIQGYIDSNTFDNSALNTALQTKITGLNDDIDKYIAAAQQGARSEGRNMIKGVSQSVLDEMATKNMLKSSITSDTMSSALSKIATDVASKSSDAVMKGAELKMKIPELMSQALNTNAQTATQFLLPLELMLTALSKDIYGN